MESTAKRLRILMSEMNIKQIDILNKAKPFCEKYGVTLSKPAISQYVSGKVIPGQNKLFVLGQALNVSEAWLMGYDVPRERAFSSPEAAIQAIKGSGLSVPAGFRDILKNLDKMNSDGLEKVLAYTDDLLANSKYLNDKYS